GCELHSARRARVCFPYLDMVTDADANIAALKSVEPNDVEPFIFGIGRQSDRGGGALGLDFDNVAVTQAELLHGFAAHAGSRGAEVLRLGTGDLELDGTRRLWFGHILGREQDPCVQARTANGGRGRGRGRGRVNYADLAT